MYRSEKKKEEEEEAKRSVPKSNPKIHAITPPPKRPEKELPLFHRVWQRQLVQRLETERVKVIRRYLLFSLFVISGHLCSCHEAASSGRGRSVGGCFVVSAVLLELRVQACSHLGLGFVGFVVVVPGVYCAGSQTVVPSIP